MFSFMIEGKLAHVTFLSRCNVVLGNELVLVTEGMIAGARFPSLCNEFLSNAPMLFL